MRSRNEHKDSIESSAYRELQLLSEVETRPDASQRELSRRLGIALGLTNLLLRNLVQKGYVRATHAHWKRWIYALTPEGFAHKFSLTVSYVHRVLDHYGRVRHTLREQLRPLALHEESRVAIFGTGEFAELVYLGLREMDIEEIDIFSSDGGNGSKFLGIKVQDIASLRPDQYDQVIVAFINGTEEGLTRLLETGLDREKMVAFFGDVNGRGAS